MKPLTDRRMSALLVAVPILAAVWAPALTQAQTIAPAADGTGTAVTPEGNILNIQGGSLSRDGANLFHSFQKFGLSEGETANFLSNPDIRNIFGRVIGGDASYINGLIQVSGGNSNLFLMNPAGILFGPNASLNVPASFTATTATGIGFGAGWFNAVGSNDYNVLVGTPSAFNFAVSQPGAIVNEGNLSLTSGSSLTLLGGTVINTGTLTSPGGNITVAAVPGDSAVRISQEGHLLSLDIEPAALTGSEVAAGLQPLSLPQLLTGRPDFGHASALSVSETGEVFLTGSGVRIPASGGIAAGNIDTSSESGDGGAITLNATLDIITDSLQTAAGGTGTGGNIAISSSAGGINTSAGVLDASSYDGDGGNVTLTAERDIITGEILSASGEILSLGTDEWGTEQFSSKGGTGTGGNITLDSRSGAIDSSAGSLSAYSLESDGGSVTLTALGDIKTGNIRSPSGFYNWTASTWQGTGTGNGGNIALNSSAGGIDTASGRLNSNSKQGNGGSVTLTASGDIQTGDISSFSGYYDYSTETWAGTGSGGNIALSSSAGAIDTASGRLFSDSSQRNAGSVTLTASGNIKISGIDSHSEGTGSGGNITLNSSAGSIDSAWGWLESSSFQGNGGSVSLTASGDIKIGEIESHSYGTGSGGNIALNSRAGAIDAASGVLSSYSNQGNGGSVTLTAFGDIKIRSISSVSHGTGSGGKLELNSSAGGIDAASTLISSSSQGNGGSVTLTASGDIKASDIKSYSQGAGSGGNISLTSRAGAIDTTSALLDSQLYDSSSSQGNGGSLTLSASGIITTGDIKSSGFLRGGDITITSQLSDIINQGFIEFSSESGTPGALTINAFAGSISTGNLSGARNVTIAGGGKDEPIGASADASVTAGAEKINTLAGNVTLAAHNDITVNEPIQTDSIASLELIAGRSININASIDTSGSNGDIALRANNNSANLNYREKGPGSVRMAPGTALNAGSGNIVIELGRLAEVGDITLSDINTAGALTVSAATGNILRSSPDSLITAGSAFFQTARLGTGGIGLPAEPLRISVRNLEATAGSGGAFFQSPEGGVTVGGATDFPIGILTSGGGEISISAAGNITIAETVSAPSILSGDAGNITLNSTGGVIDTRAGSLNSSAAQGNGGAVTLTASGDIKTGDISSSSDTGTGGKIALNSSGGGIDTVSGMLSSDSSQENGGSVTLTAFGDIKAGNILSCSYGTGSGGDIALTSSAGGIDTTGAGLSSFSDAGNGGAVTLMAFGNIKAGNILSSSYGTSSGGDIALTSSAGTINTANNSELSSTSTQGNAGAVTLTASGDIKTSDIRSFSWGGGSGGNIQITSIAGGIDTATGALKSDSNQGHGGSVTLRASGDIKTANIESFSQGAGSGGNIELTSHAGGIDTAAGWLYSYSSQGNGGSVTLTASGDIKTAQIASMAGFQTEDVCEDMTCVLNFIPLEGSTGTGGNITIESSNGAINTSAGALNTMSSGGAAGSVTIHAARHVETASIRSDGFSQGGNLSIRSDSSNSIAVGGNLDTYSTNGTAGDITLSSPGRITLTANITSYGQTQSGDITVSSASNTVETNAITTQSGTGPAGNITINGNNIAAGNLDSIGSTGAGNIEVRAGSNVTTLNIQSRTDEGNSGKIDVSAGSDISTGSQTTSATNGNSGNITNTAGGDVTAGNQTTSAINGNSGNITNTAGGDVTAGNQTTSATNGNSGNITNTAGGNINTGNQTSSAIGGTAGTITNSAGGSINTGNLTSSGTQESGEISLNSGTGEINTGEIRTGAEEVSNASNSAAGNPSAPAVNSTPVANSQDFSPQKVPQNSIIESVPVQSSIIITLSGNTSSSTGSNSPLNSNRSAQQMVGSLSTANSSPLAVNAAEAVAQLEQRRDKEFGDYFGQNLSNQLTNPESIRDALATIASQTGNRSAIIYVTALPEELELVVLTPEGKLIRKTVPAAKRENLFLAMWDFREILADVKQRNKTSYLQPAQQLYQWLIAPIEAELQAAKIDTLLFSMDAGLRSLPVAALHDGKQFIVEKYSLALIPSVSLMDTRYQSLKGAQVLAMGASQFRDQNPLPAVPVELDEITQNLWQGKAFLNQDFTRSNLMAQRSNYSYPIIHLATHGEFQAGNIGNSYIQLWDEKLRLDELRNLRLNSPPVELLVLSACRTAIGDEKAELGFAGFAVAAGVKTAMASLWYVSDAGTLGLMTEFYSHLSDAKIKAEALRQAQLAMIRGEVRIEGGELRGSGTRSGVSLPAEVLKEGSHNLKHPYYWSGFTMIGSPW
ncbi:CHAT domain-containing protein [Kamptonema formosum]|uniref:CHAT domain-containing protein n=1 Tax=Kamptonema formosum TaxID=331992 RepID=UPI000348F8C3|nr:CHAT domain-containing protein [Oscillatoria sp. PCC 10802]